MIWGIPRIQHSATNLGFHRKLLNLQRKIPELRFWNLQKAGQSPCRRWVPGVAPGSSLSINQSVIVRGTR